MLVPSAFPSRDIKGQTTKQNKFVWLVGRRRKKDESAKARAEKESYTGQRRGASRTAMANDVLHGKREWEKALGGWASMA